MEAAARLPVAQVRTVGERLLVERMWIDDETAVRLAREREQGGDDVARLIEDAIEIGARVLDRERVGANADFVRAEFERAAHELEQAFVERARLVAERLDVQLASVFAPESGHVTRLLDHHFGEGSSSAVQHQVRAIVSEAMTSSRTELVRQFSSADASNPLADFKAMAAAMMKQAADRQAEQLLAMSRRLEEMGAEVRRLHAEREKQAEVAAERDRGTAKGRTYEESVYEAIDAIATGHGDDCEAVGDQRGAGGRKGDVLVAIDACAGPARGRIVFEAKSSKLSRNAALAELDDALRVRDADYAVLVVPEVEKLPARTHQLRELGGDKLFVVHDPGDGHPLALEVAYALARARVLMARTDVGGVDPAALGAEVERALGAMEDVRRVKSQLTQATSSIGEADRLLELMARAVRGHLGQIEQLLAAEVR